MRTKRLIILVVVLVVVGLVAWRVYQRTTASPFAVGTLRAGRSFKDLAAEYKESEQIDLKCTPIAASYRICRGPIDGPKGTLTVVVNERGRVVIIDRRVTEVSAATKELTAQLTVKWNEESAGTPLKRVGSPDATRWSSEDNNWSAVMTTQNRTPSLTHVVLTDERTLAAMDARTLPALLVLSREGVVSASALDAAERRAPGALAKAADRLAAEGQPLAEAAAKLPTCGPQAALGIDPGQGRRVALGGPASELLTQAMARMFPDRRLELRDSVYLVDADGVPELIEVTAPVLVKGGAYAFAVSYAGRAGSVALSTQTFDAPPCRAPAEIVVAHLDRSRTRVTAIDRFATDDESLASKVVDLSLVPDGKSSRLVVHTLSTYGAADWYGEVDWLGTVDLESLRVVDPHPTTLAKMDSRARVAAVDLAPLATAPALGGKRVTAIVQLDGASSGQAIVLPSERGGRPSGWTMLTIL